MQSEAQKVLDETTHRAMVAVATAVQTLSPFIDKDPKGLDAVVLSATLRAFADVIEYRFGEGNTVGPLKRAVDDVRARLLTSLLKVAGS